MRKVHGHDLLRGQEYHFDALEQVVAGTSHGSVEECHFDVPQRVAPGTSLGSVKSLASTL